MSNTARAKYQTTAPAEFSSSLPVNPRKDYTDPDARPPGPDARPPGRSGGGPPVSTPHRVSSSRRKTTKKASRRRG
jgi:hypothetical protein